MSPERKAQLRRACGFASGFSPNEATEVMDALDAAEAERDAYKEGVAWESSCLNCAKLLSACLMSDARIAVLTAALESAR